jgi:hypothetical protein
MRRVVASVERSQGLGQWDHPVGIRSEFAFRQCWLKEPQQSCPDNPACEYDNLRKE